MLNSRKMKNVVYKQIGFPLARYRKGAKRNDLHAAKPWTVDANLPPRGKTAEHQHRRCWYMVYYQIANNC